jgi:hypothetical protein
MHALFPETLSAEWVPPAPLARHAELAYLEQCLRPSAPQEVPRVAVVGPRGAGSSTLTRYVAARWVRRSGRVERGRVIVVPVRWCAGTVGVASNLLRAYDEGFGGRGFSVAEVMAGFVRRLLRENRPVAVVLDDAGAAGPELRPILHALLHPAAFLPEGLSKPPTWAVLVAGTLPAPALQRELADSGWRPENRLTLAAYSGLELEALLLDRARRALGTEVDHAWVAGVVARTLSDGGGARRAIELLRSEFELGPSRANGAPSRPGPDLESIEPRLLAALARATASGPCELGALREAERRLAEREGAAPLAATTLWRRMIRLEQMGVLDREVRSGGPGGSRSLVRLRRPLPQSPGATEWSNLRASGEPARGPVLPAMRWERVPARSTPWPRSPV